MRELAEYKKQFIEFMVRAGVLKFGEFTLKSGRVAPYFMNLANCVTGSQNAQLGNFYANCFMDNVKEKNLVLYGPAYKGIALALVTANSLFTNHGIDLPYFFNRKEIKNHGEGGIFVGHNPNAGDNVVIIEDVMTAGTAFRESLEILKPTGVNVLAIIVSVDRMEKGSSEKSALQEVRETGVGAYAIVNINEIVAYLHNREIDGKILIDDIMLDKIKEYRLKYGVED